jgi:3'-5' exoribonuclease
MGKVYHPHTEEMREMAKEFGEHVLEVANIILDNKDFAFWTGSLDNKHHYGKGGLSFHTHDVITIGRAVKKATNADVDDCAFFLAALFHDFGKIRDYAPVDKDGSEWQATQHKRNIHHITRSVLVWDYATRKCSYVTEHNEDIIHAILAHHGQKEWGSPVLPNTKLAWLLHFSDALSARLNDCVNEDYPKDLNQS